MGVITQSFHLHIRLRGHVVCSSVALLCCRRTCLRFLNRKGALLVPDPVSRALRQNTYIFVFENFLFSFRFHFNKFSLFPQPSKLRPTGWKRLQTLKGKEEPPMNELVRYKSQNLRDLSSDGAPETSVPWLPLVRGRGAGVGVGGRGHQQLLKHKPYVGGGVLGVQWDINKYSEDELPSH